MQKYRVTFVLEWDHFTVEVEAKSPTEAKEEAYKKARDKLTRLENRFNIPEIGSKRPNPLYWVHVDIRVASFKANNRQ